MADERLTDAERALEAKSRITELASDLEEIGADLRNLELKHDRLLAAVRWHRDSVVNSRYWKPKDRRLYKLAQELEEEVGK